MDKQVKMTYKEAWCRIFSEISNTYDDEVQEALFMLAVAAKRQDDKTSVSVLSAEKLEEIKNIPISILDKNTQDVNAAELKFEEYKLK